MQTDMSDTSVSDRKLHNRNSFKTIVQAWKPAMRATHIHSSAPKCLQNEAKIGYLGDFQLEFHRNQSYRVFLHQGSVGLVHFCKSRSQNSEASISPAFIVISFDSLRHYNVLFNSHLTQPPRGRLFTNFVVYSLESCPKSLLFRCSIVCGRVLILQRSAYYASCT